jgi:DNA-binding NtrC family response regulator
LKPNPVVSPQSFAPSESNQPGAIALVFAPTVAELVKLHFGNRGKPATKIRSVVDSGEAEAALASASLDDGEEFDFALQVESFERKVISKAITRAKGSKIEARRLLNLRKSTFFRKLSSLGLE